LIREHGREVLLDQRARRLDADSFSRKAVSMTKLTIGVHKIANATNVFKRLQRLV